MVHVFLQNSLTRLLASDFRALLHFFPFFEFPRADPSFEEHLLFSFGQVIFNFLQFELLLILLGNTSLQPEVEQTKSNYILEYNASIYLYDCKLRKEIFYQSSPDTDLFPLIHLDKPLHCFQQLFSFLFLVLSLLHIYLCRLQCIAIETKHSRQLISFLKIY